MVKISYARKFGCALLGTLLLGAAGMANAVVITFSDCLDGAPPIAASAAACALSTNDVFLSAGGTTTLTLSHSVIDNGFTSATDSITAVSLVVDLNDDGADPTPEEVNIYLDLNEDGDFLDANEQVANNFAAANDFTCAGTCNTFLQSALSDGLVNVRLAVARVAGPTADFFFADSLLTVTVNRNGGNGIPNGIPEPGSILLLGSGLAGLALASRRRNKHS